MTNPTFGVVKESVTYGRKFDLGNYESLDLEVTLWFQILNPEVLHAAMTLAWALAKNATKFAYVKATRAVTDETILENDIDPFDFMGVAFETVSVKMSRKVNTGKKYENATLSNSLWYNVGDEDSVLEMLPILWQSVFNNIAAGVPSDEPVSGLHLGLGYGAEEG